MTAVFIRWNVSLFHVPNVNFFPDHPASTLLLQDDVTAITAQSAEVVAFIKECLHTIGAESDS